GGRGEADRRWTAAAGPVRAAGPGRGRADRLRGDGRRHRAAGAGRGRLGQRHRRPVHGQTGRHRRPAGRRMSGAAGRRAAAPAVRGQVTGPAVRADGGGGPIELAIMLPLLLMCVFATAHASMYVLARQAAMAIAQVGVDAGRGDGLRRAERFTALLPSVLRDVSVTLTCDGEPLVGTCDGEQVAATVTGTAVAVIPWLEHRVSRTATGPVERVSAP